MQITPKTFNVSGSRSVPFNEVTAILEPLAGKPITLGELAQHVSKITTLYQDYGYPLSFALLQEQDFSNGVVQVTVVEGYIEAVVIEGEPGRSEARLNRLAQPLLAEQPLTRRTLERTLNLMRTVPGVHISPKLELPRHESGATTLQLEVSHQPVGATGSLADMGTGTQGLVSVTANSVLGLGEEVNITAAIPTKSEDVRYIAGSVDIPLTVNGLSLTLDGFHYRSEPRDDALEYIGWERRVTNERIGASLSYPFILENRRLLKGRVGLYATRTKDEYHRDLDGAELTEETHLRVAHAQLEYRYLGTTHSFDGSLGVYKGIDGMGARKRLFTNYGIDTEPNYKLDFTRYTANLKHSIQLPANFGLVASATGQYSSHILPSTEQISFGAWRYALGYPQGDMGGDKGYGLSLELNRRFGLNNPYVSSVQPYISVDHARAWYNAPHLKPYNDRKLSSAALGLRLTDDKHYIFDVNVAKPTGSRPDYNDDRKVRFNTNFSLLYSGL